MTVGRMNNDHTTFFLVMINTEEDRRQRNQKEKKNYTGDNKVPSTIQIQKKKKSHLYCEVDKEIQLNGM